MVARTVSFALFLGLTAAIFWTSLTRLVEFSLEYEHYSHIVVIPLISGWLLVIRRTSIFADVRTHWSAGLALIVAGTLLFGLGSQYLASASENDRLAAAILAVVAVCAGGFVLCYGVRPLRRGLFAVSFLLLMVPLPDAVLSRAVSWLQTGSAEVADAVFQALGVPVYRTGFLFALPGVTIEIAQECSGIRSSLALLVVSLLAGHLLLRSAWTKAALTLASLPLLVVKNGLRIVTLTLLSIHVDPQFLTGSLHQRGGILFFLPILGLLALVLRSLQRLERRGVIGAANRISGREHIRGRNRATTNLPSAAGDNAEIAVELTRRH
jgi:exosortase